MAKFKLSFALFIIMILSFMMYKITESDFFYYGTFVMTGIMFVLGIYFIIKSKWKK